MSVSWARVWTIVLVLPGRIVEGIALMMSRFGQMLPALPPAPPMPPSPPKPPPPDRPPAPPSPRQAGTLSHLITSRIQVLPLAKIAAPHNSKRCDLHVKIVVKSGTCLPGECPPTGDGLAAFGLCALVGGSAGDAVAPGDHVGALAGCPGEGGFHAVKHLDVRD